MSRAYDVRAWIVTPTTCGGGAKIVDHSQPARLRLALVLRTGESAPSDSRDLAMSNSRGSSALDRIGEARAVGGVGFHRAVPRKVIPTNSPRQREIQRSIEEYLVAGSKQTRYPEAAPTETDTGGTEE